MLVTTLTATMIVGMAVLVVLFVTRFPAADSAGPALALPDTLDLPPGTTVVSVSRGADWWAVATEDGAIHLFDDAGQPIRTLRLP